MKFIYFLFLYGHCSHKPDEVGDPDDRRFRNVDN